MYLAVTNQVISAALVARQEVEEIAASVGVPSSEERENSPARPYMDQDKEKALQWRQPQGHGKEEGGAAPSILRQLPIAGG